MPTEPERSDTTHADKERCLIEEAQRDTCEAFPWLPPDRVRVVVEYIWAEYDDARIRDFIPVLVRKQSREELRAQLQTEATDPHGLAESRAESAGRGSSDHNASTSPLGVSAFCSADEATAAAPEGLLAADL